VRSPSEEYGECDSRRRYELHDEDAERWEGEHKLVAKGVGCLPVGRLNSSRESSPVYTVPHPEKEQKAHAVGIGPGREKGENSSVTCDDYDGVLWACHASGPTFG
jgi:hypothetical protein